MQIISEGWEHGRNTPPMMDIIWEDEWETSLEDIRSKYSIPYHQSIFPPGYYRGCYGGASVAARSTNTQTIAFQPAPSKKREGYQAAARHAVKECLSFRVAERDKGRPPASQL